MKPNTHPKYHSDAKVTCTCGNTFTTGSTLPEINVEICSNCHPFFTGEMKFVDTQGRVEKFQAKRDKASKIIKKLEKKTQAKQQQEQDQPKTLREMLEGVKSQQSPKSSKSK